MQEVQDVVVVPTLYVLPTENVASVPQTNETSVDVPAASEPVVADAVDEESSPVVEAPAAAPVEVAFADVRPQQDLQPAAPPAVANSSSPAVVVPLPQAAPLAQPVSQPVANTNSVAQPVEAARSNPEVLDSASQQTDPAPGSASGQMVITFDPSSMPAERAAYLESLGAVVVQEIAPLNAVVVLVPSTFSQMPSAPFNVTGEPNYYVSALVEATPNDTLFPQQWGLQAMDVPSAWAATPEQSAAPVVAVVDSGICAAHPDLEGRILPGWDFVEDDSTPQDEFGHGCSVSGIIASNVNNGIGIAGVSSKAHIMPLRVLDATGIGTHAAVAQAILLAVDHGAQVINLSLGSPSPSTILEDAVNYAAAHGVTVVAAAGNSGREGVYYPAAYASVIAVGAVDETLARSSFSSYGPEIDGLAPGSNVLATTLAGDYQAVNGTSFSAAYVSGAVALAMEQGQPLTFNGGLVRFGDGTPQPTPTPVPTVAIIPGPHDAPPGVLSGVVPPVSGKSQPGVSLSTDLATLAQAWTSNQAQALEVAQTYALELTGNLVAVTVTAENASVAEAAKATVRSLGGVITSEYDRWFDAQVPVTTLVEVASLPGVSLVQPIVRVFPMDNANPDTDPNDPMDTVAPQAGSHLTQGVAASNANAWHTAGIDGTGVTVAILDSFTNIAGLQSSGELPSGSCLTTLGTLQSSTHGSAVAEIVHDMAPGACMILVSPTSGTEMASRITELANYPAATRPKIITSSIGYYNLESGDGTGAVSNAIGYALSKGILFTQAAGNQAQYNWQGNFVDSDSNGWLNFTAGDEINNFLNVQAGYVLRVYMRWNAWPTTDQDYDLWLYHFNTSTSTWEDVASSTASQTGTQSPTESIAYVVPSSGTYGFAVYKWSATGNQVIDVMGHNSFSYEYDLTDRSLIDPASSSTVFGVAALNTFSPYNLESYSSRGPAMGSGGSLATGNAQPRIAGYANVDTATSPGFNGTSSATPHVAGAAALVWDAFPTYTTSQVKSFLEGRAVDMGSAGYDYTYGAGRLYLGAPPTSNPAARDGIGIYARATGDWYLRTNASPGAPNYQATYGGSWAQPVVGDWNGDGTDTIGVYNPNDGNWYLRNTNSGGTPSVTINGYGGWWGMPLTGDWDGNGTDTIGLFVPNTGEWILRNSNSYGGPDIYFSYGGSWGYPVVGDWNGDGIDTIGVYNPTNGNWYLRNTNSGGGADVVVSGYGGWWGYPIIGDWDGNGTDTIGLFAYQTGEWLLRNTNSYGSPDIYFAYGGDWGTPLTGDWNGPGTLAAEMMTFSQDWDAINRALSSLGTEYSLEDMLRFSLDPSSPLGSTATPEAVAPATQVPLPTAMENTEIKPTPLPPMMTPQAPVAPAPVTPEQPAPVVTDPPAATEVTPTDVPLPTEEPTSEAPATPDELPPPPSDG
ncbi:MAG: S8 family serine peptidase [Anaerolineae bacterium]|nr:S8 family serine peptidase [Anaerolineae bacterium]